MTRRKAISAGFFCFLLVVFSISSKVEKEIITEKQSNVRWSILLMVMGGVFLSTMDSGMVNIALPTIMQSFSVDLGQTNLVVIVYLLTITATLVFWGKISDRYGKGNIYLLGVLVFGIGAVSCGFSSTFDRLLLSRFTQAVGASMMMSSGPALIKAVSVADKLGQSLGLVGIATASGLMSGPVVSGLLLTHFSWQAIFFVTVPISGVIFFFGRFFFLKYLPPVEVEFEKQFDWKGSCCWAILVIVFVLLLNRLPYPVGFVDIVGIFLLAAVVWLFLKVEKSAENPIIPFGLVRQKYYSIALATAMISFAALFVVLILIPFYLKYILNTPADKMGFVIMALPATLIVISPLSGFFYDKIGGKFLTSIGLFICSAALFSLTFLSVDSSLSAVAINLALLGAGQSIFLSPNSASVLSRVSDRYAGITAGILATARNFGMVIGTTFATILFTFFLRHYGNGLELTDYSATTANQMSFLEALRTTFMIVAAGVFLGSILSFTREN